MNKKCFLKLKLLVFKAYIIPIVSFVIAFEAYSPISLSQTPPPCQPELGECEDPTNGGSTNGNGNNTPTNRNGNGNNTPVNRNGNGNNTPANRNGNGNNTPANRNGNGNNTPANRNGNGNNTPANR
ncbi:MAG: hypothetical protein AAF316_16245, partial [Cyanobacteria bacterium P01_A01_bin.80]